MAGVNRRNFFKALLSFAQMSAVGKFLPGPLREAAPTVAASLVAGAFNKIGWKYYGAHGRWNTDAIIKVGYNGPELKVEYLDGEEKTRSPA